MTNEQPRSCTRRVVLGKGRGLFDGVSKRVSLDLVQATPTESGRIVVSYRTRTALAHAAAGEAAEGSAIAR